MENGRSSGMSEAVSDVEDRIGISQRSLLKALNILRGGGSRRWTAEAAGSVLLSAREINVFSTDGSLRNRLLKAIVAFEIAQKNPLSENTKNKLIPQEWREAFR
mmetsp:Transcript_44134/g.172105  ORF Transcript_44134/g.172105 Transcript_44134/m.172105 type:complete len:104 (-) Transcript_44134:835-1146(-)